MFSSSKATVPIWLQSEASECGALCAGMIYAFHGGKADQREIRRIADVTLRGMTLEQLIGFCSRLGLIGRPIRIELSELRQIQVPAILHWDLNHFVVLSSATSSRVRIVDPKIGVLDLSYDECSRHLTGVALELTPSHQLASLDVERKISLREVLGDIRGLRRSLSSVFMLACALEAFVILSPFLVQLCLDFGVRAADIHIVILLGAGFGALLIAQSITASLRANVVLRLSAGLNMQWGSQTMFHLFSLPMKWYERRTLGDITSRMGSVRRIQSLVTTSFVESFIDGALLFTALAVMLIYAPVLTLLPLCSSIIYGVTRYGLVRAFRSTTVEMLTKEGIQQGHFIESVRGMQSIKANSNEQQRLGAWLNLYAEAIGRGMSVQALTIKVASVGRLLFGLERIATTCLAYSLVISNSLTIGMAVAVLAYREMFAQRALALSDNAAQIGMVQMEADRLADILLESPPPSGAESIGSAEHSLDLSGIPALELRDITVRYSINDTPVLYECSISIDRGETIAITGASGSGKSTLIKAMLGLIDISSGEIRYSGRNLRSTSLEFIRSQIGSVLQDDQLFGGSISENVSFFATRPDQARIEKVCQLAAISLDINRMPMGYSTLVGDMGTTLSGGQKQRILLARALYKNPSILILDEATSHLDVGIEKLISNGIRSLGMTTVIVAHRPETIALANRVVRLRAGQLVD